nr:GtrA family protein [Arenimonas sp.]
MGYALVGGAQLLADWLLFVLLTGLGLGVVPGNLLARMAGASLGYWLNGRYTFARDGQPRLGAGPLGRFVVLWLLTTSASTLAMHALDQSQGLHAAWLGKPLVDAALAAAGFLASKYWVYR